MNVIVVNGKAGVGKDTFVEYAQEWLRENHLKSSNISTITPIKYHGSYLGWNGIKDEKGRQFLSDLKKLSMRYDGPTRYIDDKIKSSNHDVFFVHIREPEESDKLKKLYPSLVTIRVDRDVPTFNNDSDKHVDEYSYDYIVYNNEGLDRLKVITILTMDDIVNNKENI